MRPSPLPEATTWAQFDHSCMAPSAASDRHHMRWEPALVVPARWQGGRRAERAAHRAPMMALMAHVLQGRVRAQRADTQQHPLWLRFAGRDLERAFCQWHAQQLSKVVPSPCACASECTRASCCFGTCGWPALQQALLRLVLPIMQW